MKGKVLHHHWLALGCLLKFNKEDDEQIQIQNEKRERRAGVLHMLIKTFLELGSMEKLNFYKKIVSTTEK